jgi:Vitamin K-dependent gamma-carboxylase
MLFGLASAASACLVLGWHTRIASIVAWTVITSLNDDAPALTSAADGLLALLLFWGIFLPLGRMWALDARREPPPPARTLTSVATAGVLVQMGTMYFFSGVGKWTPPWLDGTALGLVLSNPNVTRHAGILLTNWWIVPQLMTRFTLAAELMAPLLMFSPWKTTALRSGALGILIAMHVGIQVTMKVLMFSIVALAGLTCFIPLVWWESFPLNRLASLCDRLCSVPDTRPSSRTIEHGWQTGRMFRACSFVCSLVLRAALAVVIVYCLAYNAIDNFAPALAQRLAWWQQFGVALKMTQRWSMFYDPRNQCFEAALMGRKRDGTYVDLFRPGTPVLHRTIPPTRPGDYPCERILQLVLTLPNKVYIPFRAGFVENAAHHWNASAAPQDKIEEVYLTYYPKPPHEMSSARFIDMWHCDL